MTIEVATIDAPARCCAPLLAASIDESEAATTAQLFKALSDKHRVRIVNLLANADEAVCVCDLTDEVGLSQPTMSFHLKKLMSAGLLQREERGKWAYYSVDPEALKRLSVIFESKGVR